MEEYHQLHSTLEQCKFLDRNFFLTVLGNLEYQLTGFLETIDNFERRQTWRFTDSSNWKKRTVRDLIRIKKLCTLNMYNSIMTNEHDFLEFAGPRLFIVLPKDFTAWNHNSQGTHHFRLYYLCEFEQWWDHPAVVMDRPSRKAPRHVHICSYQGYDLDRPYEFIEQYGQVALAMLLLVRDGFVTNRFIVPPLKEFSVLSSCNGVRVRHPLTKVNTSTHQGQHPFTR